MLFIHRYLSNVNLFVLFFHQRGASAKPDLEVTSLDISSAFCSLAEVYLTDACFADEAEGRCQEYCQKALEYDATNPEAYQVMANYLLSLDNKKVSARKCLMSNTVHHIFL